MHCARDILEMETDTLVFHMDDRSTDFLTPIYEGKGYQVITGAITEGEAVQLIKKAKRVFMLGHGGPSGLFTRGFTAGDRIGKLLAEKEDGVYIWCNADAYAVRNKLTGLVSGMFISEVGEAAIFGIRATQEEVDFSNQTFSRTVRGVMDNGQPHSAVRERYTHATHAIIKFNSDRLYVFDHGTASPALHQSSMAIPHYEIPDDLAQRARSYGRTFDVPADDDYPDFQEVEQQIGYWTSAVLDGVATPEEGAEGITRHMTFGEAAYSEILAALKSALEHDLSYDEGIEAVMDVLWP